MEYVLAYSILSEVSRISLTSEVARLRIQWSIVRKGLSVNLRNNPPPRTLSDFESAALTEYSSRTCTVRENVSDPFERPNSSS